MDVAIFSAVSIINLLMGLLILLKDPKNKINISFSIFAVSISLWVATWAMTFWVDDQTSKLFWTRMMLFGPSIIPTSFLYFSIIFPRNEIKVSIFSLIAFFFAPSIIFLAFVPTDFYIKTIKVASWGIDFTPGAGYLAHSIFLASFVFATLFYLGAKYTRYKGIDRGRILYVLIGVLIAATTGVLVNYLLPLIGITWLNKFGPLATTAVVACTAYAIIKHELMDIKVVITRTVAYGIVGILLMASFAGLNSFQWPILLNMFANSLLGIFWAFSANRLREFIQTPLEEKWVTDWYNSDQLINNIAKNMIPVMEKETVFNTVAHELKSVIKIKNIEVFVGKPKVEYSEVTKTEKGLIIPLFSSDGIEGVLTLGPKISEDPYNAKDLLLFKTVTSQTQVVFDRIRPYEQIKREFDANQKKLYDTERMLARSEKIASLANLIREYNHEIKTPLSIIRGEAALLVKEARDAAYLEWFKNLVFEQVDRANDIVESTLRLSTAKERKEVELDLNAVILNAIRFYPISGIHLDKEFGSIPSIKGEVDDLQLVFVNLLKNAVESMPAGGKIYIKTYLSKKQDAAYVCAEVGDTGIGIPKENLEKIFEPFFSTHVTKGRGLGLSIVFRIIREHLGEIEVKSEVGKGSTFILKLPVNVKV
ncbi:MAG: ATP-binding protein [Candidatus Margulisiibacteriota bacterium]